MTKKTLSVRPLDEREGPPKLQKRGRGWNVAESRLDTLHEMARQRRREPGEAQAALAAALAKHELGKYRLHQHVVIGSAIVAFACKPLKFVVDLESQDENPVARRRDASLEQVGIKVVRYPEADVIADPDAAAAGIVAEMKLRWQELRANKSASGNRTGGARRY